MMEGINEMGFAKTLNHHNFENNLEDLAFMIQQLAPNQIQPQQLAPHPHSLPSYAIDQYPQLQDPYAGAFLENPFLQPPHQGWHDPYVEAYILDWLDHSYLENDSPSNQPYLEHQQISHAPCPSNEVPSLEDLVEQLAANTLKF